MTCGDVGQHIGLGAVLVLGVALALLPIIIFLYDQWRTVAARRDLPPRDKGADDGAADME